MKKYKNKRDDDSDIDDDTDTEIEVTKNKKSILNRIPKKTQLYIIVGILLLIIFAVIWYKQRNSKEEIIEKSATKSVSNQPAMDLENLDIAK